MAWTKFQLGLAFLMIITGSINTLSTKWADTMKSKNSAGVVTQFDHPFFQANGMFLGEFSCMVMFYLMRCIGRCRTSAVPEEETPSFNRWLFWVPALCDMFGTSLMYLGLTLTYASSFQMLRGAVIIFTGVFSVIFLKRKLRYFHWMGILTVFGGLIVVGMSDFLTDSSKSSGNSTHSGNSTDSSYSTHSGNSTDMKHVIMGDLLIIGAQVIAATQMVIEEKILSKYGVPAMLAVGYEGLFGFATLSVLLVPMYWIPAGMFGTNPRGVLADCLDAFTQLANNKMLVLAVLGNILSIAFFNFAGVSVTKELSATTRMVLDSVRTLTVWVFALSVGWQPFQYLQPIGFVVLLIGMLLYNDVLVLPFLRARGWLDDALPEGEQPLVREEPELPTIDPEAAAIAREAGEQPAGDKF